MIAAVAGIALVGLAAGVCAQTAEPAGKPIRIITAGGLLGQLDGMPEYPGGSFDTDIGPGIRPYGGLAGLADWLAADRKKGARGGAELLLLTGNNQPKKFGKFLRVNGDVSLARDPADREDVRTIGEFWRQVRSSLAPSAIGLGPDDFLRALTEGGTAGRFVEWLRGEMPGWKDLHQAFVTSNASVRLHGSGINRVEYRGFKLLVDSDASIGWVKELSFTYPCEKVGLRGVLVHGGESREANVTVQMRIGGGVCHGIVSFPFRLKPGEQVPGWSFESWTH